MSLVCATAGTAKAEASVAREMPAGRERADGTEDGYSLQPPLVVPDGRSFWLRAVGVSSVESAAPQRPSRQKRAGDGRRHKPFVQSRAGMSICGRSRRLSY